MTGYTPEEFAQLDHAILIPDTPLNQDASRHRERIYRGERQPPYHFEMRHKDGTLHRYEIIRTPVLGEQQQVIGTEGMVRDVTASMDKYELQPAATRFVEFIDQLTNWYIRRSRRRFWKSDSDSDKDEAYRTLYHTLVTFCKTAAPFVPFMTENIYRNLRTPNMPESVHLCDYPEAAAEYFDEALDTKMARVMTAVSLIGVIGSFDNAVGHSHTHNR